MFLKRKKRQKLKPRNLLERRFSLSCLMNYLVIFLISYFAISTNAFPLKPLREGFFKLDDSEDKEEPREGLTMKKVLQNIIKSVNLALSHLSRLKEKANEVYFEDDYQKIINSSPNQYQVDALKNFEELPLLLKIELITGILQYLYKELNYQQEPITAEFKLAKGYSQDVCNSLLIQKLFQNYLAQSNSNEQ